MKELPSAGGLGGVSGAAGAAGAGRVGGFGSTIRLGIGATGGGAVVVGDRVGDAGVGEPNAGFNEGPGAGFIEGAGAGFIEGVGDGAGVDGNCGIVGGFVDPVAG